MPPAAVIVRHRKERLTKCSLRGLESLAALRFFRYPDRMPPLELLHGAVMLDLEADVELSALDHGRTVLLVDATWRLAPKVVQALRQEGAQLLPRRLPPKLVTAYPRRQTACPEPERGLASVEALYAAVRMTGHAIGHELPGLLANYHWRSSFLALNPQLHCAVVDGEPPVNRGQWVTPGE
jgi:pre-rRNA-processing protein TSR3